MRSQLVGVERPTGQEVSGADGSICSGSIHRIVCTGDVLQFCYIFFLKAILTFQYPNVKHVGTY